MSSNTPAGSFCGIFAPAPRRGGARWVLVGAPWDAGSSFRRGAAEGPGQIRAMAESLNACTEDGTDLSGLAAEDRGDIDLPNEDGAPEDARRRIEASVEEIVSRDAIPILLGGDHSVTIGAFAAVLARHPDLRLLTIDAHPDLYPAYDGSPLSHACVTARILELLGDDGSRITQVGIRSTTPEQVEAARRAGIRTYPARTLEHAEAVDAVRAEIHDPDTPLYISVDVDALDPSVAPGCGNPVPGGLSYRHVLALLTTPGARIAGLDVVEVNPRLDPHGLTALTAARLVVETLGQIRGEL